MTPTYPKTVPKSLARTRIPSNPPPAAALASSSRPEKFGRLGLVDEGALLADAALGLEAAHVLHVPRLPAAASLALGGSRRDQKARRQQRECSFQGLRVVPWGFLWDLKSYWPFSKQIKEHVAEMLTPDE